MLATTKKHSCQRRGIHSLTLETENTREHTVTVTLSFTPSIIILPT